MLKKSHFSILLFILIVHSTYAADYYVDKNDNACNNGGPGSQSTPWCKIEATEGQLSAGDTVHILAGTYTEPIIPRNNEAPGNYITYTAVGDVIINPTADFANMRADPTINGIPDDGKQCRGIYLLNINYIIVEGFKFFDPGRWVRAYQADHNIIRNNEFDGAGTSYGSGIRLTDSEYNLIIGNTLQNPGNTGNGDSIVIEKSAHNVIMNNTLLDAGHATFAIRCSSENVFRNNYIYTTKNKGGEMYQLCDGSGCLTERNLLEFNVFAKSAPDGDSSAESSIQYGAQQGIIRRNVFYDNFAGFRWALYPGSACGQPPYEAYHLYENRMYHNVFYNNLQTGMGLPGHPAAAQYYDNKIINNAFEKNVFTKENTAVSWFNQIDGNPIQMMFASTDGFIFEYNVVKSESGQEDWAIVAGGRSPTQTPPNHDVAWWNSNDAKFTGNLDIDTGFNSPLTYDFTLQQTSPMIDKGTFLTTTTSGGPGTIITVDDAGFFYDGFGIPGEVGDTIQLEGNPTWVRITSIDYSTNEITINQSLDWASGDGVALAYTGTSPDIGAFEYGINYTYGGGQDNCITDQDLISYINLWKSGSALMMDLITVILTWMSGCP